MKLSKERRLSMDNLDRRMLLHYLTLDEIPKSAIELTPQYVAGSEIDSIYIPNCKFMEESYYVKIYTSGDFNLGFLIDYSLDRGGITLNFNYRNSKYIYYYSFPTAMMGDNKHCMYEFENIDQYIKIPLKKQYTNVYVGGANTVHGSGNYDRLVVSTGSKNVNTWTNTNTPIYIELVA